LMLIRVSLWGALFQGGADVVVFWAGVTIVLSFALPSWAETSQQVFVGVFLFGYGVAALKKGWAWGSTLVSLSSVSSYPVRRLPLSNHSLATLGNLMPGLQLLSALAMALGPPWGYLGLVFWVGFHAVVGWTFGLWRFASGYLLVLVAWFLIHHPLQLTVRP